MYFAVWSGDPARRLTEALDQRVEQRRGHLVADLDLQLAEARRSAPVVEHRDGVVDDAADEPPAGVVHPVRRRIVVMCTRTAGPPVSRTNPRTSSTAAEGGSPPFPSNTISGRTRNGASRSAGSFTVQPSPGRWRRLAPQRARRRSSVS